MSGGGRSRRAWRVVLVVVGVAVLMSCLAGAVATAAPQPQPSVAPLNPEFLQYLDDLAMGRVQLQTEDGHGLGYIPSPVDLSHLTGEQLFDASSLLGLPASYDLRTLGKLTPVKDQGPIGSCWAFATYGSMESCRLPGETWDFSENNLKNTHGFDRAHDAGGNHIMSTAYLARWSGPVAEGDDPYNPASGVSPSRLHPRKHVQEVIFLPDRANALDNDNIKQAVTSYGAVYSSMYWEDAYYNSGTYSYYRPTSSGSNHSICIVGWDDNYAASKFLAAPPGPGAFIIRNSWGAGWGQGGYFYVSYYDAQIGKQNAVFWQTESIYTSTICHQYDWLGWTGSMGYGTDTAWFMNDFIAPANEMIDGVSFYTPVVGSDYTIFVYIDMQLVNAKSGAIWMPGYHTVSLNDVVSVPDGHMLSVAVGLTTPGYNYPIPIEDRIPGYSSGATGEYGSWISSDGTHWVALAAYHPNANVCLKVFGRAHYYGDDTAGLYNPSTGTFYLRNSNWSGPANLTFRFGPAPSTWLPIAGDWDKDHDDTIGLYDPAAGRFYLKNANSAGAADLTFRFGPTSSTWKPIVGDWDGDGTSTIGLYDPATGTFYLSLANWSRKADLTFRFGPTSSTWIPIAGDWEGDGIDSVGLYNPLTGTFYLRSQNAPGVADFTFRFGPASSTWKPLAGAFNFIGDGGPGGQHGQPPAGAWYTNCVDTVGLYDPTTGTYYLRKENRAGAADITFRYGPAPSTWRPLEADWNGLF